MRSYLLLFVLLLMATGASAQTAYSKARIYTNTAFFDAFIRNVAESGTPQTITYSETEGGPVKQLSTADIKKIVYQDGTQYERHPIDVDVFSTRELERTEAQYKIAANFFRGNALVEKLVSGNISLYVFEDRFGYPHFFYKSPEDSAIVLLPYQVYVEGSEVKGGKAFKNLLSYLAQKNGCGSSLDRQIEAATYQVKPMITMIRALNACEGGESEINGQDRTKTDFRFGLIAGVAMTNFDFVVGNPSRYPGLRADDFPNSTRPAFGAFFSLYPSRRIQNQVLSLEVLYHDYRSKTDSIQANSYTRGQGTIEFKAIHIIPSFRYLFSQGTARPFLEAGPVIQAVLSGKNNYGFIASGTTYNYPLFNSTGVDMALMGGAGLDFGRFSVQARYHLPLSKAGGSFSTFFATVRVNLNKGKFVSE